MPIQERLIAGRGALLVVDVQDRLLGVIPDREILLAHAVRLVKAAKLLEIPVWATEQYPKGLGPTVPPLAALIPRSPDRRRPSTVARVGEVLEGLHGRGRPPRHSYRASRPTSASLRRPSNSSRWGSSSKIPADAVGLPIPKFDLGDRPPPPRIRRRGHLDGRGGPLRMGRRRFAHPRFKDISALIKEFGRANPTGAVARDHPLDAPSPRSIPRPDSSSAPARARSIHGSWPRIGMPLLGHLDPEFVAIMDETQELCSARCLPDREPPDDGRLGNRLRGDGGRRSST